MPRVPRPLSGCDVRSLPLSPVEAFLFSRIDGALSEVELSQITGMTPAAVAAALDRLTQLRAITADPAPGNGASSREPPRHATPPPSTARPAPASAPTSSGRKPRYTQAELDEVVEIEPERKRAILELYYRLDDLTYYEVLGVGALDDKKKIKAAYYALAPDFHPDRFFRKQLGAYKQKIEAIFARLTLAQDVLTSRQRREEYDDYLDQTHRNRSMSALLDQTPNEIAKVVSSLDTMPVSEPAASAPPRSADASGFRSSGKRFLYWAAGKGIDAAIEWLFAPAKVVNRALDAASWFSWATGREASYLVLNSAVMVESPVGGGLVLTTREGSPWLVNSSTGEDGMAVPSKVTSSKR